MAAPVSIGIFRPLNFYTRYSTLRFASDEKVTATFKVTVTRAYFGVGQLAVQIPISLLMDSRVSVSTCDI